MLPWMPDDIALYDHAPLRQTLERLVDFDRLNRSDIRLTVGCADLESGDEVLFDTTRDKLAPEHFLASTAITPIFPPVEIGGRLLCDPGYTNNLPLDVPFAEPMNQDFSCIAVELFSLHASRPASLDSTAERERSHLRQPHAADPEGARSGICPARPMGAGWPHGHAAALGLLRRKRRERRQDL